jgi:hypothetical protein
VNFQSNGPAVVLQRPMKGEQGSGEFGGVGKVVGRDDLSSG